MADPNDVALSRSDLERVIDVLITMLDDEDPDPDLEDNGDTEPNADDEPSLGWPIRHEQIPQASAERHNLQGYDVGDDREGTGSGGLTEDDEPDNDDECTLGWQNPALNVRHGLDQTKLSVNSCHDGEVEPSLGWTEMEARYGRYAEGWFVSDGEASLGWQNTGSQARLHSSRDDREEQCEDEGAEHDGREPDYSKPPRGYVGFDPNTGQPIVENRS